jgi:predicted Zn-dependent protease
MLRRSKRIAAVCVLLTVGACAARQPGTPPTPGINFFSKEQDIQLGQELAAQARQQLPVVQDPYLQSYVDRIGRMLVSQPEAGDFPYSFTLVNDKSINAFALPGGPIFLNLGLFLNAENEAQVAGVMAHEIAHVALRHGTSQASKANLIQLPALIAAGIAGNSSVLGQLAQLGIGLGANSLLLKYSRDAEREADALGARIMAGAGYNPIEMARFFERLEAEGGARGPEFFSSHPSPGNRVKLVQEEIRYLPKRQYHTGDPVEFQKAKARAAQIVASGR